MIPEYRLLSAILERALLDWYEMKKAEFCPPPKNETPGKMAWRRYTREEICNYFFANDTGFTSAISICDYLGIDIVALRAHLLFGHNGT